MLNKLPYLISLDLSYTGINDLSFLAGLTNITFLGLNDNLIQDVSPLSLMVSIRSLNLTNNNIGGLGIGNVDQLASMIKATSGILLGGAGNVGMSCQELDTLIAALNVGGKTVVTPAIANPTATPTNPQTCTAP